MTTPTLRSIVARTRGLGLVLVAGLALSACDNSDPTTVAINKARLELDSVSLPRTEIGEKDQAEAALSRIVSNLRSASADATPGQKQAASLLMAQAQLGVSDRRAALASRTEGETVLALTPMRRLLDNMLADAAGSSAALAFNPEPEVQRLQAELQAKDAEIAQRQRDRAQVEGDILLLDQGAKERLDMAAARRDEAARMAVEAMSMSTSDSARRLEDVHRIRREAATIEVDGLTLQSRADVRRPDLAERQLLLEQVQSQKAELQAALDAVRRQGTQARASAAEHATAAKEAADQLDQLLEGVMRSRQTADAQIAGAVEAYEAAQAAARQAGNDGIALVGAAAQGRGDMHWLRGQDLGQLIEILDRLSRAPVPAGLSAGDQQTLRDRFASYAQRAEALRAAQREALAAAAEAYADARDAFQRVRGTDDASRARINRLAQLMHLCRRGASGQAIDLNSITDEQGDFTEEAAPAEGEQESPAQGEQPAPDTDPGSGN